MSDINAVVDRYIAMWNETDDQHRLALAAETLTHDATYLDPLMSGEGMDGIDAMIAGAQRQFPGHVFKLVAGPDAHHDRIRFTWSLSTNGGDSVAVGTDFAIVAPDGRLASVTGFLESSGAA